MHCFANLIVTLVIGAIQLDDPDEWRSVPTTQAR
jgi:hypothetical protein